MCDVCVATEYGVDVMECNDNINIICQRLDEDGMRNLYSQHEYQLVIDATHPYATLVTQTIKNSLQNINIPYIRLSREKNEHAGYDFAGEGTRQLCENESVRQLCEHESTRQLCEYESARECAQCLSNETGNILLTTGSKELSEFTAFDSIREHIIARVIPSRDSLDICYDNNLKGSQIIAMQGPFSYEMNLAQIHHYNIKHLVTKLSGRTGGEDDKIRAALDAGVKVHVIKRPEEQADCNGQTINDVINCVEKLTGVKVIRKKALVTLAGVGCGSRQSMTIEVRDAVEKADYIFGAKRMLEGISDSKKKYPYYLAEDIIPEIEKIYKENPFGDNIVVLFSGDTGFYSGCSKLYEALNKLDFVEVKIMPGISSIQMLAARTGISWEDAVILSSHGAADDKWLDRLINAIKNNKKTFFITSGKDDIIQINRMLEQLSCDMKLNAYYGYNLSYPDEKIINLDSADFKSIEADLDKGLYAGVIVNKTNT